jgi:integrase
LYAITIPAVRAAIAVVEALPREDRDLAASPFAGFTADRLRTAIGRACKATGTPVFSPHDLRHRRATLWHLGGVPASQAAAWLGHSAQEHLRTYAHVMLDRTELDYPSLLETCTDGVHSVFTRS